MTLSYRCIPLVLALICFGTLAHADDVTLACDQLAASASDGTRPEGIAGVTPAEIDTSRALPACANAYTASGKSPRMAFQYARALQSAGDNTRALQLYLEAATAGHAVAMVNAAALLEETDPVAARTWYRKSADLGLALAQYDLALALQNGVGGPVDIEGAIDLYTQAMNQGDGYAAYNIAVLHDEGKLVVHDAAKAVTLYRKAADLGNIDAMVNLAIMLEKGEGTAIDRPAALALYRQAANLGDPEAAKEAKRLEATK